MVYPCLLGSVMAVAVNIEGCDSVPVIWDSLLLARLTARAPASHANRNVTMIVFMTVELVK